MKITIVGCGNAFSTLNYNQCYMLEDFDKNGNKRRFLLDFGVKTPLALHKLSIDIKTIDEVYISHLHCDHVGGLEELAFLRYDWINKPHISKNGPNLIGNHQLLKDWWDKTARGGLESMEGFVAEAKTWFKLIPIQDNDFFNWCGWKCIPVQQIHIMSGSMIMNTFGLIMKKKGHKTIYFTTDSQHCSPKQMEIFYKEADIIFQDCECNGVNTLTYEMKFCSGVHANYAQLAGWKGVNAVKLSKEVKNKMLLSHYQDFVSLDKDNFGNDCNWDGLAEEDGFFGFVKVGQTFDV